MLRGSCVAFALVLTLSLIYSPVVSGKGFLVDNAGEDYQALKKDLQTAMEEVLGCGGQRIRQERLVEIERDILPMWRTMPSNANGRLDWRSLRYVAHRYFMQQSSLLIKGLEPSRSLNSSEAGHAEILTKEVPQHAELLFGGKRTDYSIDDAAAFL